MRVDVAVVGGGAAGLTAARGLSAHGFSVALLEARDRLGGRIATLPQENSLVPLELGAEFVHGRPPEIVSLPASAFVLYEIAGQTWTSRQGHLRPGDDGAARRARVLRAISAWQGADCSLASFLDEHVPASHQASARRSVQDYVEGFDAADAATVSIHWLAQTEQAAVSIEGNRLFRLACGYGHLVAWLRDGLPADGMHLRLNAIVHEIQWSPGQVLIRSHTPSGDPLEPVTARAAVITLPLGVMTAAPPDVGAVRFVPELQDKQAAYEGLGMGHALKVVLRFREAFWDVKQSPFPSLPGLSFLFAPEETFPTWWTSYPLVAPLLNGWVGGPRAASLAHQAEARITAQAIESLAHSLHVSTRDVEAALDVDGGQLHNWSTDPFARGAYSYVRVGGLDAPRRLGAPLARTLFFAGEATDAGGQTGTVHAALASGQRVVDEIVQSR